MMAHSNLFLQGHLSKNILLVLLSLIFLPLDTFIVVSVYALGPFLPFTRYRHAASRQASKGGIADRQTILVTGISMTKALVLARLMRTHRIIGADFSSLACGRVSRSLDRFYLLSSPASSGSADAYISSLVRVIEAEHVGLWISCSAVASALEDGVAAGVVAKRTGCRVVQFSHADVRGLHEKDAFMERTRRLGLQVPETFRVESADEMVAALRRGETDDNGGGSKQFIAKAVGVDDRSRGDLTLLPCPTEHETYEHVARLGLARDRPWIVQEFIRGREFCTHALVVRGRVRAFVACPSSELLMYYRALPAGSALSRAMLSFTVAQANAGGDSFTGHLSFDFLVKDGDDWHSEPESIDLYPIECNPRVHTADVLFNGCTDLAEEYLAVLQNDQLPRGSIVTPCRPAKYYWIGHDLVTLLLLPVLSLLTGGASLGMVMRPARELLDHILFWKDGTFEIWDPLPWWWLYHVYWPMQFINSIRTGRRWSRINVSTTKMFDC